MLTAEPQERLRCSELSRKFDFSTLHTQGAPIKNNRLEQMLYFSCGIVRIWNKLSHFYASIQPTYPANFIEITDRVPQIQRFEL